MLVGIEYFITVPYPINASNFVFCAFWKLHALLTIFLQYKVGLLIQCEYLIKYLPEVL